MNATDSLSKAGATFLAAQLDAWWHATGALHVSATGSSPTAQTAPPQATTTDTPSGPSDPTSSAETHRHRSGHEQAHTPTG
jgi:hypothetical protein